MKFNYYPFRLLAKEYNVNSSIFFQFLPDLIKDGNKFNDESFTVEYDSISDLSVNVIGDKDGYSLNISYSEKYSKEFIARFAQSYKRILSQIICVDELSDVDCASKSDLELLNDINKTERLLDYGDVLDAFNDNLNKRPDNKLVSFNDRSYSYAEGAFIADKVAKKLIDLGVSSDDRVAFLTERCEYYMFSVLGIMSIGGVYVPLDDNLPDECLRFLLDDSDAHVVIVSDKTYVRARDLSQDISILNISEILKEGIGALSSMPAAYGDLACILYTSGTTGVPKGVKITRKAVLNLCDNYVTRNNLTEDDVYGLFASIGFDAASQAICQTFYAGACLSIIPEEIRLDVKKLNEYMVEQKITHTMLTTQMGKLFMEHVNDTSLNVLTVGGEKLGEFENHNDYKLIDGFGPTETFAFITSIENIDKIDPSSIGFLNYNTKAYILDNELRPVSCGAVGELYLAGSQIAAGYLNNEKETSNAFIDNPFSGDDDYGVMYRTGDMVRLLPDDSIGLVGRRDSQVKIRGNRVELSEIEAVIREIDYVEDVSVQAINDDAELVAYVVVSGDDENIAENIKEHVLNNKPEFMVPSFVMILDSIPLTVNGKVDKRALPEVDLSSLRAEYAAPENETERSIVEAFEKVFGQKKLGVHDSFIHLGGDSLTAIRLLSYLEDYNISVADILSLQTPREIAKNVKDASFDLDIYSLDSGCPLSEPQLNVYLDIVANDKTDSYLIPLSVEISKEYGIDEVKDAINTMLDVHPILKMCVSDEFEMPCLVEGFRPEIIEKSDDADDFIAEFLAKPFDLHERLSRFLIVQSNDGYKLFAVFHHIIFDALSDIVFKRDLELILNGKSIELDDSFLKVSAFSQQIRGTEDYVHAKDFYEHMLAPIDEVGVLLNSLLSDGPGTAQIDLDLNLELLKSFLDKNNTSENVLFTSAFAYTLSRFVGGDKVLFSIVENGRDRFSNFNSIGMYVNTLPILFDCRNQDVSSFIGSSTDLIYDVLKYNYYPFRLLANEFSIDSNIIFQFLPEWVDMDDETDSHESLQDNSKMNDFIADFNASVAQKGSSYSLNIDYSDAYSKDIVVRFMESYKSILSQMLCVKELSEISYISQNDLKILDEFNQNGHPFEYDDILEAFNENLAKYPNSNLVSFNDKEYTYCQGAFIADKIAGRLRQAGVESQDNVAFLVERSEWYMFNILGILSIGAVYVPLDTNLPDNRIKFILDDIDAKAIVVSDETERRAKDLSPDCNIINISDIPEGTSANLDVVVGDLACILYTSGSTGVPKGVKVTRKSALNVSAYYADTYGLSEGDVYGMFTSIGFDAGSLAILSTVYAGACLSVMPEEIRLDINKVNEYFIKHGVTQTFITTQLGKLFLSNVDETSLDVLVVGGEKLGDVESPEGYNLIDIYGPTEAFVFVASSDNSTKIDSSSVGKLVYNTKAYILDEEKRFVPVGATGELYLAGHQISEGYLNNSQNDESFIDNPFDSDGDYGMMYRTGDLVRILPDMSLAIVGRRDNQVKVRGNRVELAEIELMIRELDYVDDVTVQTIKNGTNNELVAYVVTSREVINLRDAVCRHIADDKPDYMVPSYVVEMDEIPLNVNGKVDRSALPEIDLDPLKGLYVPPKTELEKQIVKSFETVFNQEKIGLFDDFVSLGGDSLTAIRIKSILGMDFDVRTILKDRTPFKIAKSIGEGKREYGFELIKEGSESQNMFLLPPQGGASFIFIPLVNNIDFKGNIYIIDDFKYDLTIDEIKNMDNNHDLILSHYYDAIKDLFQDGDIIVGYSLGCIYGTLLAEKLEPTKKVGKCILIDGPLDFINHEKTPREEDIDDILEYESEYKGIAEEYVSDFKDKIIEIYDVNSIWDFHTPKVNSHVIYLGTRDKYEESLKDIFDDCEFILIDSTHHDIIANDVDKINEYLK